MMDSVRLIRLLAVFLALAGAANLPGASAAAGTPTCGIFVSTAQGVDDATCGLDPSSPCATIAHGIDRAVVEAQTCLFVQAGVYNEVLTIAAAPLSIYGGYDADWDYAPKTESGHLVVISGGFDAPSNQYLTLRALPGASVEIANLEIHGANATGAVGVAARSSYAIHAEQATLTLNGVRVVGGNGAGGVVGTSGSNAPQSPAAPGQPGGPAQQYVTACDNTSRGAGGSAGVGANPSQNGGNGGPGGTMDTDCNIFSMDLDARPGMPGANANVFLNGGYGYRGGGGGLCGPGGNGQPGSSTHGSGGSGAAPGGTPLASYWAPNSGGGGALGADGTGGGGGGGSGGCDAGTDAYGAGGGGGGAGGVRAVSAGGGGGGGGSSFCVFAISSTLVLTDVDLQRAGGGQGGAGGTGGAGQPGGNGGLGGNSAGGAQKGGDGGAGGHGGHSGGGGGGAGGSAYGVWACNGSYTPTNVGFAGGAPGSGGQGGPAPPGGVPGGSGPNGSVFGAVLTACPAVAPAAARAPANARVVHALAAGAVGGAICDPAPCMLVDVPGAGERFTLSFAGALPNPATGRATFHFALPAPARATLHIFDAGGRLVRALDAGTLGAGRHRFEWDGRNEAGARAGAGVYFARFEALETEIHRRFTLVR